MARFLPEFGVLQILVLADNTTNIILPNPLTGDGPIASGTTYMIEDNLGIAGVTPIRPIGPLIEATPGEAVISIPYGALGLRWIDSLGYVLVYLEQQAGPPGPPGPPGPGGGGVGSLSPVMTKTAAYSILPGDSQTTFDNGGAAGLVPLTLPPFSPGLRYGFVVSVPQVLKILSNGSDSIAIGMGVGASIQSNVPFSTIVLGAPHNSLNTWTVFGGQTGSWSTN